jgi:hypothetical protein
MTKTLMVSATAAALAFTAAAPAQAGGNGGAVAAGIIGGLAVGGMLGAAAAQPRPYYGPPPAYVYDEPAYAPRCYYTRGEPVWDSYRGIWVRPRVRVCD